MEGKNNKGHFEKFLISPITISLLATVISVLIGLVLGGIILAVCNMEQLIPGLGTIMTGGIRLTGGVKAMARFCYYAMPLIMCGLSLGFAFKTGTLNIGASGQYWVGAFAAIIVASAGYNTFGSFTWVIAVLAAAVAGAVWALIPGILNAYRNVNIIISGIMMNYIGTYMVSILIKNVKLVYEADQSRTLSIPEGTILPKLGLDKLLPSSGAGANAGILIAIALGCVMYFIVNKTILGYELKTCGFNREAARYAGISEKRSVVLSMVIAGALAGVGGALVYLSSTGNRLPITDTVSGIGFTGIAVALLGMMNPLGIILAGFFVSYLNVGGANLQMFGFSSEIVEVILAVIIFSCAFAPKIKDGYYTMINKLFQEKEVEHTQEQIKGVKK